MEVDYIIVGFGLAGMSFAHVLEKKGKSFVVFEDGSQHSSRVAGGMYNPVILRRFTPVWNAASQLEKALPFYRELEEKLSQTYDYPLDIYRVLHSVEEQNNWYAAADRPALSPYMIPRIIHKPLPGIRAGFGFGKLSRTGRVAVPKLIRDYRAYLENKTGFFAEKFVHTALEFKEERVQYNHINAGKVVFCEGFGLLQNPFFKQLPLPGSKGEVLTIHAPGLQLESLVKSAVFILPLGNDYYKVGATFHRTDKTDTPTEAAREELLQKLRIFMTHPFKVVDQAAGVRPTVADRRPLVGKHPQIQQLAILNGLGTRGVMIAPETAEQLYDHLETGKPLLPSISINRFQARWPPRDRSVQTG
ncbi:MAG: FAD-dependent oxidoreductase [Lutibacter sp.]|nr:FAD-dependent oxidoreductase [Lutibacter sp.]